MTLLDSAVWSKKFFSDGWKDATREHPVTEPATGSAPPARPTSPTTSSSSSSSGDSTSTGQPMPTPQRGAQTIVASGKTDRNNARLS